MNPYMRPYIPGQVTLEEHSVVCVPGLPPYEVTEPLAAKVVDLLLEGKEYEARVLLIWFGAETEAADVPAE